MRDRRDSWRFANNLHKIVFSTAALQNKSSTLSDRINTNPVLQRVVVESILQRLIIIKRDDSQISALVLFCKGCILLFKKDI